MCYHVSINKKRQELEKRFQAKFLQPNLFKPLYYTNGFDMPRLPVITSDQPDKIQLFYWGLIPQWIEDEASAQKIQPQTLNSRAETIFSKPSFKVPIQKQRCLILIDGFYDWRTVKSKKYPYFIKMKNNQAFALAGIWDQWQYKAKHRILKTFSIVTTTANDLVAQIHNIKKRMPVVLTAAEEKLWLSKPFDKQTISSLLKPADPKALTAYPISKLITARGEDKNIPDIQEEFKYTNLIPIKIY